MDIESGIGFFFGPVEISTGLIVLGIVVLFVAGIIAYKRKRSK